MLLLDLERYPLVRTGLIAAMLVLAVGLAVVWGRSALVGAPAIGRPIVGEMTVQVLEREEDLAKGRVRILVATHEASDAFIRARLSVPDRFDTPALTRGTTARMRLRLIPPSRALVPGAYDFARTAWFEGISATGSVMSEPEILTEASESEAISLRNRLADHVRSGIADGGGTTSAGAIAATLMAGDRGGMDERDAQAMRDAGLAHLLSISGLHVGAVIAIAWFLVMRGLALWPWLALRLTLPLVAAATGAAAGIGYTLLTGAALPTVRACLAALLVLTAMALGRRALSMRLIAIAAMAVMLFWPEAAIGPSFQLSFAAVIAIVALQNAEPVAAFRLGERDMNWGGRLLRWVVLLFLTGLVIELALLPLVLFHFHRAGLYGAVANLAAIPLTTLVIMPLLALSFVADLFGLGGPLWSLSAKAIEILLAIARETAGAPGSIHVSPLVPVWIATVIAAGGLWLALWSGRLRLLGLLPIGLGTVMLITLDAPDLLVSGDGRHLALRGDDGTVYLLRTNASFARDVMLEMSGRGSDGTGKPYRRIEEWPGARCNANFCALRAGWSTEPINILIARGHVRPDRSDLTKSCAESDIVIAEGPMPSTCRPRWLKLDGQYLSRRGGAAIDFSTRTVRQVRPASDRHGW